jgi:hypothetical protein
VKAGTPGVRSSLLEKWVQILFWSSGLGPNVTNKYTDFYQDMDKYFDVIVKTHQRTSFPKRKAMIQFNYVFRQGILRLYGDEQLNEWACYFPVLKGKDKLAWATAAFSAICDFLGWYSLDQEGNRVYEDVSDDRVVPSARLQRMPGQRYLVRQTQQ